MKVQVDPAEFTFGEIMDWEAATGHELSEAFKLRPVWELDEDGDPVRTAAGAKVPAVDDDGTVVRYYKFKPLELVAFAWIIQRRTDPAYTLEQAKSLKFGEIELQVGPDQPEDPTPPDNEGGSPTSA